MKVFGESQEDPFPQKGVLLQGLGQRPKVFYAGIDVISATMPAICLSRIFW